MTAIASIIDNDFTRTFMSPFHFRQSLPQVWEGFKINIELMLKAEVAILIFALILAVVRTAPGRAFAPLRWLAIIYIDFFRAVPLVLVALAIGTGFGNLAGPPGHRNGGILGWVGNLSFTTYGVLALTLTYSAYVAEVYRAGIQSVHPSQRMAARSLGLSYAKSMRFVILPQAIRRVIPPLLNDFIGLQKDTAIIGVIGGVTEAVAAASGYSQTFSNYTGYLVASVFFIFATIPLTRYLDDLIARRERREQAQLG